MYGKPGCAIVTEVERPPKSALEALSDFPVAVIGDGLGRQRIMDAGLKPLSPEWSFCGSAITVEVDPADNLMLHAGLKLAQKGDVLVVNAHGDTKHGIWGEIMASIAARKGLAGLVIDGAVRDLNELLDIGFPVVSRAVCPLGGSKTGDGQVNLPISCGGVPVNPGDIVVADADGVLVVPSAMAEQAIEGAIKKRDAEAKRLDTIENAEVDQIYPAWLVPTLREKGVLGESDDF